MISVKFANPTANAPISVRVVDSTPTLHRQSPVSATPVRQERSVQPSTIMDLRASSAPQSVFGKPDIQTSYTGNQLRAWAAPPEDIVSRLMERNESGSMRSISDRWRGLGGALLDRFRATQEGFQQTVVDYYSRTNSAIVDPVTHEAQVVGVQETSAVQALGSMRTGSAAASFDLQIQTRSGQTVSIKLAVDSRSMSGSRGLSASIETSGRLSDAERAAVASLADGLDKALDGLGQADVRAVDMSGLLAFDRSVLSGLDLRVANSYAAGLDPLKSFELHAGPDQQSIKMQGRFSEMSLDVDLDSPLASASQDQRQRAIESALDQIEAMARRSHADDDVVAQFKAAFAQLHAPAPDGAVARAAPGVTPVLQRQVQPLLSGLSDFEASLGNEFHNGGQGPYTTAAGNMDFRMSQATSVSKRGGPGAASIEQIQSEELNSDYKQSRNGAMLDVSQGNYDSFHVEDESLKTTLIEAANNVVVSANESEVKNRFMRWQKLENHSVTDTADTRSNPVLSRALRAGV